jgi:putative ABC transport system permease protein
MIGLGVVSTTLVVGESVKAGIAGSIESSVQADHLVFAGIDLVPPAAVERLSALDEVDSVVTFQDGGAVVDDDRFVEVGVTDLAAAGPLFDLDVRTGTASDPSVANPVLVTNEEAERAGLAVGDTVTVSFATDTATEPLDLTVIGVFHDDLVVEEPYLIDRSTWADVGGVSQVEWAGIALADGIDVATGEAAYAAVLQEFPQIEIQSGNAFAEEAAGIIDRILTTVNALVVLAVIIALVGIANTLALSVFERTRELGLLRAVGMSRGQVRRMIRAEAALVALFGAVLGVAVGILFGWGAVEALPGSVGGRLAIPVDRIAILMAVAGLAGLLAAWGPARRAGRLDVLDAIAA